MASLESAPPVSSTVFGHADSARIAASEIKRPDLTELKMLKVAPKGVLEVARVLLSVLNHSPCDLDWLEAKKIICEMRFPDKLKCFDPSTITLDERAMITSLENCQDKPKISAMVKMLKWLELMNKASLKVRTIIGLLSNRLLLKLSIFLQEGIIEVDLRRPLGMKLSKSASVHSVIVGGQFDLLGVQKGDQIVAVGSTKVYSSDDFAATLKLYKAMGGVVFLTYTEPARRRSSQSAGPPNLVVDPNEPAAAAPKELTSSAMKATRRRSSIERAAAEHATAVGHRGTEIKNL
jgi:hypothetical protein